MKKIKKIEQSRKLMTILKRHMKTLNMEDWDIDVAYEPKPDCVLSMEVDVDNPEYKMGSISVYKLEKKKDMDDSFIHELLHLKLGTLLKHHKQIIENQSELLMKLGSLHEERLIEDLVGVIQNARDNRANIQRHTIKTTKVRSKLKK